jgi:hypothetical protein
MVHAHFYTGGMAARLADEPSYDPRKAERDELREHLSYCACGHKAEHHREDKDGNLLECSGIQHVPVDDCEETGNHERCQIDCDCKQFHYPAQIRETDVIQLGDDAIAAEPTVIDKLRAITEERGATKDEVIAAQTRIIALMQKEAA